MDISYYPSPHVSIKNERDGLEGILLLHQLLKLRLPIQRLLNRVLEL